MYNRAGVSKNVLKAVTLVMRGDMFLQKFQPTNKTQFLCRFTRRGSTVLTAPAQETLPPPPPAPVDPQHQVQ